MCKQLSLLPLMHQFDKEGYISNTTYYEDEANNNNLYYLVFHTSIYTMFLPDRKDDWLEYTLGAEIVIITKGSYNGKKDCFELQFIAGKKPPYSIFLTDDQFDRETPLKKDCWHGKLEIYVGGLYNCKQWFNNCYYREEDELPCCKPVENMPEFTYEFCDDDD
jgi:hypothetical protein